jgi:hypothetical protein
VPADRIRSMAIWKSTHHSQGQPVGFEAIFPPEIAYGDPGPIRRACLRSKTLDRPSSAPWGLLYARGGIYRTRYGMRSSGRTSSGGCGKDSCLCTAFSRLRIFGGPEMTFPGKAPWRKLRCHKTFPAPPFAPLPEIAALHRARQLQGALIGARFLSSRARSH